MLQKIVFSSNQTRRLFSPFVRRDFFSFFKSRAQKFKEKIEEAENQLKVHQYQTAIDLFKEALENDDSSKPQADKIMKKMAITYFSMNQIDKSIQCYLKLQEKYPNDQNIQIAIGLIYGKSQNPEKALAIFEDVLEKDPKNAQLIQQVAIYCEQLGLIDKSIEYYTKCIELNPKDIQPLINIGYIYIRSLKDCEKSLEYLLKAYELDINNVDLIYNIGMCYFDIKNNELALQYLKKCLDLDPTFHDAKRNIRYIKSYHKSQ